MQIKELLSTTPMIPVLTMNNLDDTLPLCTALMAGGLSVIEITLRTKPALKAVEIISKELPEISVGVGTLLDPVDLIRAKNSGACFAVSPGLNMDLVEQAQKDNLAYLPGIQTSSEAMTAYRYGLRTLKFFPAKAAGGIYGLKQLQPVYPDLEFCPTGGIDFSDAPKYLREKNVVCVGGSFASPSDLIEQENWKEITRLATMAASL
ncbi:bifunctional 4-hydroxy-2-oxoglutarate aldolase/2-dehydro-3-deoxy-phosphogluconate aldolase [Alphaproteobacteria bacterium]|nr:bifunctional 4-hydroxy-2-oxoglutarate aldolase/2-dehydro-3-deoxy-phosphogluconate aldolase [Alphaproteobacteria bacterium]